MKKLLAITLSAVLGLSTIVQPVEASWGACCYGGYQPWWNIFAKKNCCCSPEEERLQRFWHDYYDALSHYYCALDHIDWVAYYKNHGYQINAACGGGGGPNGCCPRIQFAPVFVSPQMQWAVPNGCMQGPPACPPGMGCPPMGGPGMGACPPGGCMPGMGMPGPGMGMGGPGMGMGGPGMGMGGPGMMGPAGH